MERFPPSNVDLKVFLGGFCSEIIIKFRLLDEKVSYIEMTEKQ